MASKSPAKTFPTMNKKDRALFDLHLAANTKVSRPQLVDYLFGGMNALPIVEAKGKVKNPAWAQLHSDQCAVYTDESQRSRNGGASQVEAIRAYIKNRIAPAYAEAFGKDFPTDSIMLTAGDEGSVRLWRVS